MNQKRTSQVPPKNNNCCHHCIPQYIKSCCPQLDDRHDFFCEHVLHCDAVFDKHIHTSNPLYPQHPLAYATTNIHLQFLKPFFHCSTLIKEVAIKLMGTHKSRKSDAEPVQEICYHRVITFTAFTTNNCQTKSFLEPRLEAAFLIIHSFYSRMPSNCLDQNFRKNYIEKLIPLYL